MKCFIRGNSLALITFVMIVAITTSCQNDSGNPFNSGTTTSAPSYGKSNLVIAGDWSWFNNYTDQELAAMHHNQVLGFVPQWRNRLQRGTFEEQILGNMDNWIERSIQICGFKNLDPSWYYYPEEYREALERGRAIIEIEDPDQRAEQMRLWTAEALQNARGSQWVTDNYVDLLEETFNEVLELLTHQESLAPPDVQHIAELLSTLRTSAELPTERAVANVFWDSFQHNIGPVQFEGVSPGEMGLDSDPWGIGFDAAGALVGLLVGPVGSIIGGAYVSILYEIC